MALWVVLFLEYWKRKSVILVYRWGCFDYEDVEVGCRFVCGRFSRGLLLSIGFFLGEVAVLVCRFGFYDGFEFYYWRGRVLFFREESFVSRVGWFRGGRDDGEGVVFSFIFLRRFFVF